MTKRSASHGQNQWPTDDWQNSPMTENNGLRSRFPGICSPWSRLDGPGGTQVVDSAVDAMSDFMRSGNSANDEGFFAASHVSDEVLETARAKIARFLGGSASEVVIGSSTTSNVFALTRALARDWREGDEIVCTQLDHDSNVAPWLYAAQERGVKVRMATVDPATGQLNADQFEELTNERTVWVAVTAASNAIGVVPDIHRIIEIAKANSARVCIDAVAFVPHRSVDVNALGCDVLTTSPYKWYAPHSGVMWVKEDLLESIKAVQIRAGHFEGPHRLEYGTTAYETLVGISAAVDFMVEVGYDRIRSVEEALAARLLAGLQRIEGVTIHGEQEVSDRRTPTVAFTIKDMHCDKVADHLGRNEVAVWSGDFYAADLVEAMGLKASGGFVRAGISVYNSTDDIDKFLAATKTCAK